jgi:hypothetical protein
MSPANTIDGMDRGYIIPIGGAEEKLNNPEILDRFVDVCGGKNARIGIIPTASELEDTGRNYEKLFRKLGVKHAQVLHFVTREDCQSNEDLQYIDKCDEPAASFYDAWRHGYFSGHQAAQRRGYACCRHVGGRCIHAGTYDCGWQGRQHAEPGHGQHGAGPWTDKRIHHRSALSPA